MSSTVGPVGGEHSDYQRAASSPTQVPANRAIPITAGHIIHESEIPKRQRGFFIGGGGHFTL